LFFDSGRVRSELAGGKPAEAAFGSTCAVNDKDDFTSFGIDIGNNFPNQRSTDALFQTNIGAARIPNSF